MNEKRSKPAPEARKPSSLKKTYLKMGHLGKRKKRRWTFFPAHRKAGLVIPLCLALTGCASSSPALYTGSLQARAGTCDPPAAATLEIRSAAIFFVPRNGTIILQGHTHPGGPIHAEATLPGIDRKPYRLVFDAEQTQTGAIEGRYITPRCAYAITLKKTAG